MRTQNADKTIRGLKKLVYTVAIISAISFLNCLAAGATNYYHTNRPVKYADNMPVNTWTRFETGNWVLNFRYELLSVIIYHRTLREYGEFGRIDRNAARPSIKPALKPTGPATEWYHKDGSDLPVEL